MTFYPFANYENYIITQGYRENPGSGYACTPDGSHNGVDWGLPGGTEVLAVDDGTVSIAGLDNTGYGLHCRVLFADGCVAVHGHLSKLNVKAGAKVKQGDVLGLSGGDPSDPNAGDSSGFHLHYEVRTKPNDCKSNIDPIAYLEKIQSKVSVVDAVGDTPTLADISFTTDIKSGDVVKVIADMGLNVRMEPSINSTILMRAKDGETLLARGEIKDGVPIAWLPVYIPAWVAVSNNGEFYLSKVEKDATE